MVNGVGSASMFGLHAIAAVETKSVVGRQSGSYRRFARAASAADPADVPQPVSQFHESLFLE
jgi:hypothetical protein